MVRGWYRRIIGYFEFKYGFRVLKRDVGDNK